MLPDREKKTEHGTFTHQSIDNTKSDVPSQLINVDFRF